MKPAAPAVMATGLYAGTTLADDGSPILLFDPAGLAEVGGVRLEVQERAARVVESAQDSEQVRDDNVLLFKSLDGRRCAIRLALVDRIDEVAGTAVRKAAGRLRVQLGDTILPLAGSVPAEAEKVRVFRLSDGAGEIGYAFAEVIDLMKIDSEIIPAAAPGEVAGVTLLGGEPAELLDPHWLFATCGAGEKKAQKPAVCRIPSDDPWMQNMLRPIVEAAGYRVIGDSDECAADLVIVSDSASKPKAENSRVLVLRSEPEADPEADSIYRYDRAALLTALKTASSGKGKAR